MVHHLELILVYILKSSTNKRGPNLEPCRTPESAVYSIKCICFKGNRLFVFSLPETQWTHRCCWQLSTTFGLVSSSHFPNSGHTICRVRLPIPQDAEHGDHSDTNQSVQGSWRTKEKRQLHDWFRTTGKSLLSEYILGLMWNKSSGNTSTGMRNLIYWVHMKSMKKLPKYNLSANVRLWYNTFTIQIYIINSSSWTKESLNKTQRRDSK